MVSQTQLLQQQQARARSNQRRLQQQQQQRLLRGQKVTTQGTQSSVDTAKLKTEQEKLKQEEEKKLEEYNKSLEKYNSQLKALGQEKHMYEVAKKLALAGKGALGLKGKYLQYYKKVRQGVYGDIESETINQMRQAENLITEIKQEQNKIKETQQQSINDSQWYMSTNEGVVDTRTGQLVTGGGGRVSTPTIEKNIFGLPKYQTVATQNFFKQFQQDSSSKTSQIPQTSFFETSQVSNDFQNVFMGNMSYTPYSTKDLKTNVTIKEQNGTSNILGAFGSNNNTFYSQQLPIDTRNNFTTNFFGTIKKDLQKKKTPFYTPQFGTVMASPLDMEAEERKKEFQKNIWTADPFLLQAEIKQYEKLTGDVEDISGNELDRALERLNSIGANIERIGTNQGTEIKITPPKIYLGSGEYNPKLDITSFKDKDMVDIGLISVSKVTGKVAEVNVKKTGFKGFEFTSKEKELKYIEPLFGTIQTDSITGAEIFQIEKTGIKPAKTYNILTPQQIGKGAEIGATVGVYSIPFLGTGLFSYEVGKDIYKREVSPMDVILVGGMGGLKVKQITKSFKTKKAIAGAELSFVSKVEPNYNKLFGTDQRISTISKTQAGDETYWGLSRDWTKKYGKGDIGLGSGMIFKKDKWGYEADIFASVGKGKEVGKAFSVDKTGFLLLSEKEGVGVLSQSYLKDLSKKQFDFGVQFPTGTGKIKFKNLKIDKKVQDVILAGGIKKTDTANIFSYTGGKPITTKGGIPKYAYDIKLDRLTLKIPKQSVKGKIYVKDTSNLNKEIIDFGKKSVKLEQQTNKQVLEQVAAQQKAVENILLTGGKQASMKLQKGITTTKGLGGALKTQLKFKQKVKPISKITFAPLTSNAFVTQTNKGMFKPLTQQLPATKDITGTAKADITDVKFKDFLESSLKSGSTQLTTTTPRISTLKIKKPRTKIPKFNLDSNKDLIRLNKLNKQPTNLYVKSGGKFKRVTKNPIQRNQAKNLGMYITDQTLSRQFKLKKSKKPVKKPLIKVPSSYGRVSDYKFRPYKIKKGVKQPLVNRWIEKKQYIGDTSSELKKLNVAKFLSAKRTPKKKSRKIENIGGSILQGF